MAFSEAQQLHTAANPRTEVTVQLLVCPQIVTLPVPIPSFPGPAQLNCHGSQGSNKQDLTN